jgi:hypothetical protein
MSDWWALMLVNTGVAPIFLIRQALGARNNPESALAIVYNCPIIALVRWTIKIII